jgi:hypothetical protein
MVELIVKSSSFGVMEFTVKKPRYVPSNPQVVPGNIYNVVAGVTPPPPVVQYPVTGGLSGEPESGVASTE